MSAIPAIIIVGSLLALWCSDQLVTLHDSIGQQPLTGLLAQVCTAASAGGGCEKTAASAWAEITIPVVHRPVPVALLGWIYFSFIAVWYALNGSTRLSTGFARWIPLSVAIGGAYGSLFFTSLMVFGRVPWCAVCAICHVLNSVVVVGIFVDAFLHRVEPPIVSRSWRRPILAIVIVLLMVTLLQRGRSASTRARELSIDLTPYQSMVESARSHDAVLLAAYNAEPLVTIPSADGDLTPARPHRLVVFTDMQCPACAANAISIRDEIIPAFGDSLTVEIRHFPLCTDCNSSLPRNPHPDACTAAYAAEAAKQLGGPAAFAAMTDALHEHRDELTPPLYDQLATDLRLPLDRFHSAVQSKAVHDAVRADVTLGSSLGVINTPTLFLDSRRVPQLCMTQNFWRAVASKKFSHSATTP